MPLGNVGTFVTVVGLAPAYRVVLSVPLSDTHSGEPGTASVPGEADRPQALTRSGSVNEATPGWSDTMLICWYVPPGGEASADAAVTPRAVSAPAVTITAACRALRPIANRVRAALRG